MQPVTVSQLPLDYPGAIFPSRLEWLCQPEQIEQTLCLLYYLNTWKKASQQLLYADRQGLREVQALILEQATKMGMIQPALYLDGTRRFPGELLLESAAASAARGVIIHLKGLRDPEIWPPFSPDGDRMYQLFIRPFYRRLTGKDCKLVADVAAETLDPVRMRDYIQERLNRLISQAQLTRRPLSARRLAALCIAPIDLLHIRDNRLYFLDSYDSWDELDISDQRKLDPEGYSEIAFRYRSATAEYVFHLPLRWSETFLSPEQVCELQKMPGISQEYGIFQDRRLEEEESGQRPAREILQDLGVDIASVCPHKLLDKESYLAKPAIRDILWPTREDDHEEWEDDPWDGICLPANLL